MSDQTRGIIFVVVVVVITFVWVKFFQPPPPPPQKTPAPVAGKTVPGQNLGAGSAQPSAMQSAGQAAAGGAQAPAAKTPAVQAAGEQTIVVEGPLYRVEFSNRGAVVRSWTLKTYFDDQKPPHPLDLVNPDSAQELGWPLSLTLSDPQLESQANSALYQVTPASANLTAPVEIDFHWSDGHLDVTKKLKFEQGYQLSVEVSASLNGQPLAPAIA